MDESERRKRARGRQAAKAAFDENLSVFGCWRLWIQDLEEDPLVKLLIEAIENLRRDVGKRGMVVYSQFSGSHIGTRRLGDRVRKHLLPVIQMLPVDFEIIEALKFDDPHDYRKIEMELNENITSGWYDYSRVQTSVTNALVPLLQELETLSRALSHPVRFCRFCFRRTVDDLSRYCFQHHPAEFPSQYKTLMRRKAYNPKHHWRHQTNQLAIWHAKGNSRITLSVSDFIEDGESLLAKLETNWEETKFLFEKEVKDSLPFIYKKIPEVIKTSNSWNTALKQIGQALRDFPPDSRNFIAIIIWLRAAESWFSYESGFELDEPSKSEQIRRMLTEGYRQSEVVKSLGVSRALVCRITKESRMT